ncbi:transaldolase family protein [Candidatus Latescibacterota bacterium]
MKLFLDTADITHIKEAASWGIIDGVTTNPTLIKKAVAAMKETDIDMESYIKKILASVGRMCPVSLEVGGLTADEMVEQGITIYEKFDQVAGNVVIKIPVCPVNGKEEGNPFDGIIAINRLSDEKIPINATLIFTPEQAMLAAKAGAEYVSPFAGRIDDRIRKAGGMQFEKTDYFPANGIFDEISPDEPVNDHGLFSGVDLVARIVAILKHYNIECEVIAASVRNAIQARECAEVGADIATMPFDVLKSMVMHPGTRDGIDAFTNDLVDDYTDLFISAEENPEV